MAVETTEKLLLCAAEVASLLGISRSAFYSLLSCSQIGPLPTRLGRSVRWSRQEIEAWIAGKNPINGKLPTREQWLAMLGEQK